MRAKTKRTRHLAKAATLVRPLPNRTPCSRRAAVCSTTGVSYRAASVLAGRSLDYCPLLRTWCADVWCDTYPTIRELDSCQFPGYIRRFVIPRTVLYVYAKCWASSSAFTSIPSIGSRYNGAGTASCRHFAHYIHDAVQVAQVEGGTPTFEKMRARPLTVVTHRSLSKVPPANGYKGGEPPG